MIADNTWAAFKGRKKLKSNGTTVPHAAYDSAAVSRKTVRDRRTNRAKSCAHRGHVDAEFKKGGKMIEAEYYAPHLAHASMEPPVAVAEYRDGKVTHGRPRKTRRRCRRPLRRRSESRKKT